MKARAEASERLSDEIVASLTSGLLVVDRRRHRPHAQSRRPEAARTAGRRLERPVPRGARRARPARRRHRRVPRHRRSRSSAARSRSRSRRRDAPRRHRLADPRRGGRAYGAICLFTDLSEVMELEEQLRLKDSLARLGELTAGIAHEFRNGLATIHGYARLLDLERLPGGFRPYVQGIRARDRRARPGRHELPELRQADRAGPGAGRHAGDRRARRRGNPRAKCRRAAARSSIRGEFGRSTATRCCCARRSATCAATRSRRASAPASRRASSSKARSIASRRRCASTVTDNGPGITPAVAERMFRPFFTTKARGTGLGLALVQKIVVTHNGRVGAAAAGRGGARLAVTLPLAGSGGPAAPKLRRVRCERRWVGRTCQRRAR